LIICIASALSNFYDFWIVFNWDNDTWVHLTLINDTINNGVFPGNPFYPNQSNVLNYSIIHLIGAELFFLVEVPPHIILIPLSFLAILLRILVAFVWTRYLLNNEKLGLLAVTIYVISSGSIFSPTFHFLWYPFSLAITVSSLTFLFILKSVTDGQLKCAFISALLFAITIMLHLVAGAFLFLAIISFLFFYAILKGRPQKRMSYRFILFFIAGIVLAVLWLYQLILPYFFRTSSPSSSPLLSNSSNQGVTSTGVFYLAPYLQLVLFRINILRSFFVISFGRNVILISLIVIGFYKFVRDFRKHQVTANEIYLLSNAIIPVVLSFIPPLFYFFNKLLRSSMARFMIVLPQLVFATIGFEWICMVVYRKISSYKLKPGFKINARNTILLFLLIFLIMGISSLPKYVYYSNREDEMHTNPIFAWSTDFIWLKEHSAENSVVLSDPWTSYYIPYFAERKVVATHGEHSISYSISTRTRISDTLLALNVSTPIYETLNIIGKYNVSYILLNLRPFLDENYSDYKQLIGNYYSLDTPLKFYSTPEYFREVYYHNGVWVFEVIKD
jgi:hypothetical protein